MHIDSFLSGLFKYEAEEFLARYAMLNFADFRCFCSNCGTPLFNHSPSLNFISLVIATLSGLARMAAVANVNKGSRLRSEQCLPNFDKIPSIEELRILK